MVFVFHSVPYLIHSFYDKVHKHYRDNVQFHLFSTGAWTQPHNLHIHVLLPCRSILGPLKFKVTCIYAPDIFTIAISFFYLRGWRGTISTLRVSFYILSETYVQLELSPLVHSNFFLIRLIFSPVKYDKKKLKKYVRNITVSVI